jgi:hypothetical protein
MELGRGSALLGMPIDSVVGEAREPADPAESKFQLADRRAGAVEDAAALLTP